MEGDGDSNVKSEKKQTKEVKKWERPNWYCTWQKVNPTRN
jgi:hypothetical protein